MDIPKKWLEIDIKIKRETRNIFNRAMKSKKRKSIFYYDIDWLYLADTLKPLPKDRENYHIDHIIPLVYFNFVHEDKSPNLTEIKKAWSPANLRVIKKEKNIEKNREVYIEQYPLRFEFIFSKKEAKYYYSFFKSLYIKDEEYWKNVSIF